MTGRRRPARIHRPHGPALRSEHVGHLLPRAGDARAGPAPRRGVGIARGADGEDHGGVREGSPCGPAGPGRGGGGRQLHGGLFPHREEAGDPGGPRGGGAALLRRGDARGDQPEAHRRHQRPALRDGGVGREEPAERRRPEGAGLPRGERDDRHLAAQPVADRGRELCAIPAGGRLLQREDSGMGSSPCIGRPTSTPGKRCPRCGEPSPRWPGSSRSCSPSTRGPAPGSSPSAFQGTGSR